MLALPVNQWRCIEVDFQAVLDTLTPGVTYTSTTNMYASGQAFRIDDLRFSNCLTVEHNVFGGGVVGHILRNRTTNASTGVATDRWFHCDQVGSVISESDAAGVLAQTHHQDAFGNTQAAWQTGLWGGDKPGWHHNTKEYDGDTGLVYMYQRWYSPETGTFMSSAPYPVMKEHRYGFAESAPLTATDPRGEMLMACTKQGAFGNNNWNHSFIHDTSTDKSCGRHGSSGSGLDKDGNLEYDPASNVTSENPSHPSNTKRVKCSPIQGTSFWQDRTIMACICNPKNNRGIYLPYKNDCKSTARRCVERNGAKFPTDLPGRTEGPILGIMGFI